MADATHDTGSNTRSADEAIGLLVAVVFIVGAAAITAREWGGADPWLRWLLAGAWVIPFVATAAWGIAQWRRGGLRAEARAHLRRRFDVKSHMRAWTWPAVGIALVVGATSEAARVVLISAFGGWLLGLVPSVLITMRYVREQRNSG